MMEWRRRLTYNIEYDSTNDIEVIHTEDIRVQQSLFALNLARGEESCPLQFQHAPALIIGEAVYTSVANGHYKRMLSRIEGFLQFHIG
jgi:hypothetical protein